METHHRQELEEDDPHFMYYLNQSHPSFGGEVPEALMVGVNADASGLVEELRQVAVAASPLVRYAQVVPLAERVEPQLRSWRLGASMFTAFGLLALVVATWGLYSVLAFDVALRRRELGVRAALGAEVGRLVAMVLRRAAALGAAGVILGLGVSLVASRFVAPLLFDVPGADPIVYVGVALTLLAVAGVAGAIPAMRASRVDPSEALRAE